MCRGADQAALPPGQYTSATDSRDDPLGAFERVAQLAADWGSKLVDLGQVGHLNPASGCGDWPMAESLIAAQGWSGQS